MMVCFFLGGDVENRDPQNIKGCFQKKGVKRFGDFDPLG